MVKKIILALIMGTVIVASAVTAHASVSGGLLFGNPTAITLRIDNSPILGFGWGFSGHEFVIMADWWLIHKPLPSTSIPLNWYLGVGGELGVWNDYGYYHDHHHPWNEYDGGIFLGARVPIGLQLLFERRWEAFVEIAPVFMLLPTGPYANGGIGIRYTF